MQQWKAGSDVFEMLADLIRKHHPQLLLIEEDITVIFREKAQERCGKVLLGTTKKAPAALSVLTDKEFTYKFVIEIGADTWQSLSDRQRLALLDHHLCSMRVEEDLENGTIRCSIAPPDFKGYRGEVERWGMWWPMDTETLSVIEQMFGKKAKEGSRTAPAKRSGIAVEEAPESDPFDDVLEALSN